MDGVGSRETYFLGYRMELKPLKSRSLVLKQGKVQDRVKFREAAHLCCIRTASKVPGPVVYGLTQQHQDCETDCMENRPRNG